jgi:cell division protein FtsB
MNSSTACLILAVHCFLAVLFSHGSVRITRMKQAEQQRDSISVQHVETLKQKVMKLRKENESLKRKLASTELDCS